MFLPRLFDSGAQYDLKSGAAMIAAAAGVHFGDQSSERRFGPRGWLETAPGNDQIGQEMHPLAGKFLGRKIYVTAHPLAVGGAQTAERLAHQVRVTREAPTSALEHSLSFAAGDIEPDIAVVVGSESESGSMRPVAAGGKLAIHDRISDVLGDQVCDFALDPRRNILAQEAHRAALGRRVTRGK